MVSNVNCYGNFCSEKEDTQGSEEIRFFKVVKEEKGRVFFNIFTTTDPETPVDIDIRANKINFPQELPGKITMIAKEPGKITGIILKQGLTVPRFFVCTLIKDE